MKQQLDSYFGGREPTTEDLFTTKKEGISDLNTDLDTDFTSP